MSAPLARLFSERPPPPKTRGPISTTLLALGIVLGGAVAWTLLILGVCRAWDWIER